MNLNQISVPSLDLTKSIPFYENIGLKLIVKSLPHYARFECENLDEYMNDLKEKGIELEEPPTDQRWLWREAKLKDIDGNQLIFFYAGENRLNPPWRITNTASV